MIETKVYLLAHHEQSRLAIIDRSERGAQPYHGAYYLLQEQQHLLHCRQGAQVNSSKTSDGHGGHAVEEAVDVGYLVCCRNAVEDAREDERQLYGVSSSKPAGQRADVALGDHFSSG